MNFTPLINDAGPAIQMPGIQAKVSKDLALQPGESAFKAVLKQAGQEQGHFASPQIRALGAKEKVIPGQVAATETQKSFVQILQLLFSIKGAESVAGKENIAIEKDLISKLKDLLGRDGQAGTNPDLLTLLSALAGIQRECGTNSFFLNTGDGNHDDLQALLEDISRTLLNGAGAGDKNSILAGKGHIKANNQNQVFNFRCENGFLPGGKAEQGADIQKQKTAGEKIKSGDRGAMPFVDASMKNADNTDSIFPGLLNDIRKEQISGFPGLKTGSKTESKKRDALHFGSGNKGALDKHFQPGQSRVADGIGSHANQKAKIQQGNKGDNGGFRSPSAVAEQITSRTPGNFATVIPGEKAVHGPNRPVTVKSPGPEEKGTESGLDTLRKSGDVGAKERNPLWSGSGHMASTPADVNSGHAGHQIHSGMNDSCIPGSMGASGASSPVAAAGPVIEKLHENNTLRSEVISQLKQTMMGAMNMNRNRAVLQLHPPELGSVRIEITVHQQGEIHASFVAGTHEVKHLIQAGLGDLREQLSNNGFQLGSCNVDVSGQGAEHQTQKNWIRPDFPHGWHQAEQQDEAMQPVRRIAGSGHQAGVHIVV